MSSDPTLAEQRHRPAWWASAPLRTTGGWVAAFLALSALIGALCAVFWAVSYTHLTLPTSDLV